MKTSSRNKGYITNLTALVLASVFCLGASTFAVVWQQQSNVRVAKENDGLENSIASLQRHQTELNNKIASAQTLEALNRRNAQFRLNLSAIREQQLVRVTRDPKLLLDLKRNMERIGFLPASPDTDAPPLARPDTGTKPSIIRFVSMSH
ncbi:uncharacterized protein HemX [Ereboglobus sp. PH5-10]|uniref:hypothetical protein n=1 Tax=Ereboglobus sp. PH5-10 TaxID=2940629 RepID=UPI00240716D4|nr:hypothetical protein [Ereboglobus sp. PH5-10]MDF9825998.1 uncharacterized protein HemX [Ereboglobus sp. PH5-10]